MLVKEIMTLNPLTVNKEATIADALDIMRTNNFRRLPVMDGNRIVGIVTDRDLREVSPSPATSLSVFELNYLLAKTQLKQILTKKTIITIEPEALVEEAALLMRDKKIGGIPVLEGDKLVGIVTETDIFGAFIKIMGIRKPGTRITIELKEDKPGLINAITSVIKDYNGNITHLASYSSEDNLYKVSIRINNFENTDKIIQALQDKGYEISSISKNE
ncbi:MAG: CBS and ACT domain-containing protein [Peptococcaceae bacterium]